MGHQALWVNRHVAAGRAGNIECESGFLCDVPKVGKLPEPESGSISYLFVFACVCDNDQDAIFPIHNLSLNLNRSRETALT